jgi:hypothetical protein
MDIRVKKGKILVYRVFDIGSEINLETLEELIENQHSKERFKLDRKPNVSLMISRTPVSVSLGSVEIMLEGEKVSAELIARVWHFGTVSMSFHIPMREGMTWTELVKLASWLEKDNEIDELARERSRSFQTQIRPAIVSLTEWSMNEDFIIYMINELDGLMTPLSTLPEKVDVAALILAEAKENLSDSIKKTTLENLYQYSTEDLVVVDWNSALLVEPSGSMDVPLVIEFALNQLLEMRFYDDLLDKRLNTVYSAVVERKRGLFSNKHKRQAEEAGQMYIEISEIVENVENSFKTVGDFYLATIFRATTKRFRFDDWQRSINEKLSNLAEVSKLLHSEVNESRSQMMEIIVILLIGVEVIPLIVKYVLN